MKTVQYIARICITAGLLLPVSGYAQQDPKIEFSGYVKELGSLSIRNDLSKVYYDNIIHHRLETEFTITSSVSMRVDLRNRLFSGWTVMENPGFGTALEQDPGYFNLSTTLVDTDRLVLNSAIDRMQLSYVQGPWEVHAGRQRINWGKSLVWNPNDLFNAYAYLDFDYEERPGTDAVYGQYSWSYASSIEAGYRFGKTWDESVIAMMLRGSIGEYDVQVITGNYFEQWALGLGWSGYLKSAGVKGELSYFAPRRSFFSSSGHITATLSGDYMFPNAVYLTTEVLYNGGWDAARDPLQALTRPPRADELFIAKTGYFINTSYSLSPLSSLSTGLMGSFDRKIFVLIPQYSYSLGENTDLLILAQLLKGSVFKGLTDTPNIVYLRLKWSY